MGSSLGILTAKHRAIVTTVARIKVLDESFYDLGCILRQADLECMSFFEMAIAHSVEDG